LRGVIKFYNEEKDFGFISCKALDEDLYFNKKGFRSDRRPYKKQTVEFRVIETDRGKAADDIYLLRYA
jgi:cold shock CspA family protein